MTNRTGDQGQKAGDERITTLLHNVSAVRAVSSAIEGTLGPKGLDSLLVDEKGEIVITNDGVTILEKMEVKHPAARMLIRIASAQQEKVGDGTTTATLLASALVQEGAAQVGRGVPVVQVISGMRKGVAQAMERFQELSTPIASLDDPHLQRVAYIAARENQDIADLVLEGARMVGYTRLQKEDLRLSDLIFPYRGEESEVLSGVLLGRIPISKQMPNEIDSPLFLLLEDRLAPEEIDDGALGTEMGFQSFLEFKEAFKYNLEKVAQLGVNVIVTQRSCDPVAEEFCADRGIAVLHRTSKQEFTRLAEHIGAKPLKRTGLNKSLTDLPSFLGRADRFQADERTGRTRIEQGSGRPTATILIGGSTVEIVSERGRIARDAAASVQAAIKGGILSGGGSVELAVSRDLEGWRLGVQGLEGYGVDAVVAALQKPLAQMVLNAGFNPLEKLEAVRTAQHTLNIPYMGVEFSEGQVANLWELGVLDPTLVKMYALRAASEVAESILRIHTVIRMKSVTEDQE